MLLKTCNDTGSNVLQSSSVFLSALHSEAKGMRKMSQCSSQFYDINSLARAALDNSLARAALDYPAWNCLLNLTAKVRSVFTHHATLFVVVVWTLGPLLTRLCPYVLILLTKSALDCRWSALMAEGGVPMAREWQKGLGLQVCLLCCCCNTLRRVSAVELLPIVLYDHRHLCLPCWEQDC